MKIWLLAVVLAACGAAHAQWEMESSGTTADLRGIDNVGGGVAWASGTNGTVLRTEDGGYLWQACAVPPGAEHLDFRGVQAFDANTAIVMSSGKGDLSRLYKTMDGCHTWKLVFTNPDKDGFWDAMQFESSGFGVILGDPVDGRFVILGTYDEGKHWTRVPTKELAAPTPESGAFAASNSAMNGGVRGANFVTGGPQGAYFFFAIPMCTMGIAHETPAECLRMMDYGHTQLPINGQTASSGGYSIANLRSLRNGITLVVVGGDYSKPDESAGTAAYIRDGPYDLSEAKWLPAQTPPHGYRSAVAYDAATKTWITVGPNGTDISTDDGKNWRALHPDPAMHEAPDADRNWNALSLPFVVGPHGRIGKLNPKALAQNESK